MKNIEIITIESIYFFSFLAKCLFTYKSPILGHFLNLTFPAKINLFEPRFKFMTQGTKLLILFVFERYQRLKLFFLWFSPTYPKAWTRTWEPGSVLGNLDLNRSLVSFLITRLLVSKKLRTACTDIHKTLFFYFFFNQIQNFTKLYHHIPFQKQFCCVQPANTWFYILWYSSSIGFLHSENIKQPPLHV
mgnify:CR=1 FL=1